MKYCTIKQNEKNNDDLLLIMIMTKHMFVTILHQVQAFNHLQDVIKFIS